MPAQQLRPSKDLRPSRSQIEALLGDVTKDHSACQGLLDAFQNHGLLSGTQMVDQEVVDSQGRYQKAYLLQALSRIDTALTDRVMAVLEKLGGVA
jgi:hypothetical protein